MNVRNGRGSNQYQTRPGTGPVTSRTQTASVAAAANEPAPPTKTVEDETELVVRIVTAATKLTGRSWSTAATDPEYRRKVLATARHIVDLVESADLPGRDISDEDRVGFAFQHPEWAAAGFSIEDQDEIWLWDGDLTAATQQRTDHSTWWDTIPHEWRRHGWTDPSTIHTWQTAGFGPGDAASWVRHRFDAGDANRWQHAEFFPDTAAAWRDMFMEHSPPGGCPSAAQMPRQAVLWRKNGFSPHTAAAWVTVGYNPHRAARAARDGEQPRLGPDGIPGDTWQHLTATVTAAGLNSDPPRRSPQDKTYTMTVNDHEQKPVGKIVFTEAGTFKHAVPHQQIIQRHDYITDQTTLEHTLRRWSGSV